MATKIITDALHRNLHLLTLVRTLVAMGQAGAIYYFSVIEDIGLTLTPLITVLVLMCGFTALTWWRLFSAKQVTETEFFVHLCVDMLALACMVYYSGGASNPFVSYLLVPIAIGSSLLRWSYSAALATFGLIAYSLLLFYHVPVHALMSHSGPHGGGHGIFASLSLHLAGMWLNFVVSALLIAYFIVRMAKTINQQRQQLAEQREKQLQSDRLVAVATLAANTAHQLGTPINSISLLASELDELGIQPEDKPVLADLKTQVRRCKEILVSLVSTADLALQSDNRPVEAKAYFADLLERWSVLHPDQSLQIDKQQLEQINCRFLAPPSLEPAIFNLLNNAAESGGNQISVQFSLEAQSLCVDLSDNGRGIPASIMANLGQPFNSNKPEGMGIGLYLAMNTATAMGGSLDLFPASSQSPQDNADSPDTSSPGTRVRLILPVVSNSQQETDS